MSESDNEKMVRVFTIGCGGKNAREFFAILRQAGVKKVIDVRLYNTSQLAAIRSSIHLDYYSAADREPYHGR